MRYSLLIFPIKDGDHHEGAVHHWREETNTRLKVHTEDNFEDTNGESQAGHIEDTDDYTGGLCSLAHLTPVLARNMSGHRWSPGITPVAKDSSVRQERVRGPSHTELYANSRGIAREVERNIQAELAHDEMGMPPLAKTGYVPMLCHALKQYMTPIKPH